VLIERTELLLMPQNELVTIKGIVQENGETDIPYALAGTICNVGLNLPKDFDKNTLKKGTVICDPAYPIKLVKTFIARVLVYDIPYGAVIKGEQVVIHSYTSKSPGKLQYLLAVIDEKTKEIKKNKPKFLKEGMYADVQVKVDERLCLELYSNFQSMGRIVIRKGTHTIAAG